MSLHLTLYSKPGCGLCEEAKAELVDLAAEFDFEIEEVDIMSSTELFARFRYVIPVIDVTGGPALFAPIDRVALHQTLRQAKTEAPV